MTHLLTGTRWRRRPPLLVVVASLGVVVAVGCNKSEDASQPAPPSTAGSRQAAAPPGGQSSRPPLVEAAYKHDVEQVKKLIADGTDVNTTDSRGKTALVYAAGDNDRAGGGAPGGGQTDWASRDSLVALLLSHHADPNITAQDGTTPLLAVLVHHQTVSGPFDLAGTKNARATKLQELIAAGAKVDIHTSAETEDHLHAGSTPLMAAAINGDPVLVKLLIAKGADVNATNQPGDTALIEAARKGNPDAVQVLIANHADVNAHNQKGETALSVATRLKSGSLAKCADMLRTAGAKG